jgi:hypothetical protein
MITSNFLLEKIEAAPIVLPKKINLVKKLDLVVNPKIEIGATFCAVNKIKKDFLSIFFAICTIHR